MFNNVSEDRIPCKIVLKNHQAMKKVNYSGVALTVVLISVMNLILLFHDNRLKKETRLPLEANQENLLKQISVLECNLAICRNEIPDGPEYYRGFLER